MIVYALLAISSNSLGGETVYIPHGFISHLGGEIRTRIVSGFSFLIQIYFQLFDYL